MSKAIKFNEIEKLVPGVKLFHVIGAVRNRMLGPDDITEFQIESEVFNRPHASIPYEEVLWMRGVFTYTNHLGEKVVGSEREASLRDAGIYRDGSIYNLNRFFWTYEDAAEFILELNSGVFSDPLDQHQYDNRQDFWW